VKPAHLVLALALLAPTAARAQDLDAKLKALLPRPEEERWLKPQWRSDLAAGRFEANESGKPIFLWLMDGDPLGCT
jgi:hypothetical protein